MRPIAVLVLVFVGGCVTPVPRSVTRINTALEKTPFFE